MTKKEAYGQAFENGRKVGDAEGYARGKAEAFTEAGDLISRKALLEKAVEVPGYISKMVSSYDIATAPAVAAQPVKRGRWEKNWHDNNLIGHEYEECPFCGCMISDTEKFWDCNYCPNCGADMRGEDDA